MKNTLTLILLSLVILTGCTTQNSPEGITQRFTNAIIMGDCDQALELTTGQATKKVERLINAGCQKYEGQIKATRCKTKSETAVCECVELRGEEEFEYEYNFSKVNGEWKIASFTGGVIPENTVEDFVTALANGNCDDALKLATGVAKESVQETIDAGCESYTADIVYTECDIKGDKAECSCSEDRDGMEMTYKYDLEMIDGKWFVSEYAKDLDMGDMSLGDDN